MIRNRTFLILYKLLFGLMGLVAIVTEIIVLSGRGTYNPANFFSFFTIESNAFAAVILLMSIVLQFRRPLGQPSRKTLEWLRGAATLYMLTTGIVFSVLLSGLETSVLTAVPWDNTVLHYVMPVALLVDWALDPPRHRLKFVSASWWLIYPILFVVYSMVRGQIVGWYPYPFLDPVTNGYMGVAVVSAGIAALSLGLVWIVVRVGMRRKSVK